MEIPKVARLRLGRFEFNLQTGELRPTNREDGALLLPEQPFRILRMLVERGGKIVTREEIRRTLWPNDTIVNFDHSINVAIGILRRSLGDSAENPEYIETLARRGYRLRIAAEPLPTDANNQARARVEEAVHVYMIGKKVSHYRVLEVIGGGGMGMVYRAEDLRLGRRVAVKFLPPEVAGDPVALRRFEREAKTASALNHPNICTVYEVEEHDGQPFIVMELLEGRSLNHELDASEGKLIPVPRLLELALQICDGLAAAHERGIIHRDIKPANIFLSPRGQAKILDFGLAKLIASEEDEGPRTAPPATSQTLTLTGAAMGTAGYMSPEQIRGEKLDVATDIFSFGLVLYEAVTGRRAFSGETTAALHDAILHQSPAPAHEVNPAVPRRFGAVIAKAVEKERARRYQSMAEMREDLERVVRGAGPTHIRWRIGLTAAVVLAAVLATTWIYLSFRNRVTLSPSDTIVLAVTNQTRDPVFNDALYISLLTSLEQTPYLNVLAVNKVGEALGVLHLSGDPSRISPQIARQVCLQTSSKMVVAASIAEAGNNFRIHLDGLECQSGGIITSVRNDASGRNQIIHVLGVSAAQLRGRLGEPEASIRQFDRPLEQAASSSPDALQLLTEGYRRNLLSDFAGAISNYVRAVQVDPQLATAYMALAGAHENQGEPTLAAAAAAKGFSLRARLTEPYRFNAEDLYYQFVTAELEKRCAVLAQYVQMFPNNQIARYNYAGCLRLAGQPDRSLAEAREALRLLPSSVSYLLVMRAALSTGRLDEARSVYEDAEKRRFDTVSLHLLRGELAFIQRDEKALRDQRNWGAARSGADHMFLYDQALAERYYGRFNEFRRVSARASDVALREDLAVDEALSEAEVGNLTIARELSDKLLPHVQNHEGRLVLALSLALTGDTTRAQQIADTAGRDSPLDTLMQKYYLPSVRAAIKLQTHDAAAAIEILRPATPYDLAFPTIFENLYPSYLRGLAYLDLGDGRLAAVEFQRLIDHPGLNGFSEIGALSRLQLGRARKMTGDTGGARESYEDFLSLWKTADTDLPVYKQARLEYASLRRGAKDER